MAFLDDPFKKLMLLQAVQNAGGLLNQYAGLGPMGGPSVTQAYGFKQDLDEEEKRKAAIARLAGNPSFFPDPQVGMDLFTAAPEAAARQMFPEPASPYTLGEGQIRYGPNNEVLAQGPAKSQKPTSLMQEAETLYPGDVKAQRDWIMATRARPQSSVTVTNEAPLPKVEPGYQLIPLEGGGWKAEPIPGSKAAQEMQAQEQAQTATAQQERKQADFMLNDIDRAINLVEHQSLLAPVTGLGGTIAGNLPWATSRGNYEQLAEGLKSRITMDAMQQMRAASPTGSTGLGQMSERELSMLQASAGSIAASQGEDQLLYNLNRLKRQYLTVVHGQKGAEQILKLEQMSDNDLLDPNQVGDFVPEFYEQELRRRGML